MRGNFSNQRNGRGFSGNWQNRGYGPKPDARLIMVQLRFALDQLYTNIISSQQYPASMTNGQDIVTSYFSVATWFNHHAQKFAMAPVTLCLGPPEGFGNGDSPPPGRPVGGGPTYDSATQARQYSDTHHAPHGPANGFAPPHPPPVNEFQWQLQQSGPAGVPNGFPPVPAHAPGYNPGAYNQVDPNNRLPSDQTNPYSDYGGAIPANARIAPSAAYPAIAGPQAYSQPQGQQGGGGRGNGVHSSHPQPQLTIHPGPAQAQPEPYHPRARYDNSTAGEHAVHVHEQQAPSTSAVQHEQGVPCNAPNFQNQYINGGADTSRNNHPETRAPNNFAIRDDITSNGPQNNQSLGDSSRKKEGCDIGPQKHPPMSFPTPEGQAQRQAPVTFGDMDQDDDDLPNNKGEGQYVNDDGNFPRITTNAQNAAQPKDQAAMPGIPQGQAVPYHQQGPCDHVVVHWSQVTRDHPMYPHIRRKWRKERGRSPVWYYEVPRNINGHMAQRPQPQSLDQRPTYPADLNPQARSYNPNNQYGVVGEENGLQTDAMPVKTMAESHIPNCNYLPGAAAAASNQDSNRTANGTDESTTQSAAEPISHRVGIPEPSDPKTWPVLDTMPGTIIAGLDMAEITFSLPYPFGPGPLVVDGTNWPRKLIPTVHPVKIPDNRHHPVPKIETSPPPQPINVDSEKPVVDDNTPGGQVPTTITKPATPNDSPVVNTVSASDSSHTLAAESPAIETGLVRGSSQSPITVPASSGVPPIIPLMPASPAVQTGPATDDALHPLKYEYAVIRPVVLPAVYEETGPAPADSNPRPVNDSGPATGPVNDSNPVDDPKPTSIEPTTNTSNQHQQPPTKPKKPRPNNNNRRRYNRRRREADNAAVPSTGSPRPKARTLGAARSQQDENVAPVTVPAPCSSSGVGEAPKAETEMRSGGNWFCDVCRAKYASLGELEEHHRQERECGEKSEWV